jgi:hypothetical protein
VGEGWKNSVQKDVSANAIAPVPAKSAARHSELTEASFPTQGKFIAAVKID